MIDRLVVRLLFVDYWLLRLMMVVMNELSALLIWLNGRNCMIDRSAWPPVNMEHCSPLETSLHCLIIP